MLTLQSVLSTAEYNPCLLIKRRLQYSAVCASTVQLGSGASVLRRLSVLPSLGWLKPSLSSAGAGYPHQRLQASLLDVFFSAYRDTLQWLRNLDCGFFGLLSLRRFDFGSSASAPVRCPSTCQVLVRLVLRVRILTAYDLHNDHDYHYN